MINSYEQVSLDIELKVSLKPETNYFNSTGGLRESRPSLQDIGDHFILTC